MLHGKDFDWAEEAAAAYLRFIGFEGVKRTPKGADGGIDAIGPGVLGQVKYQAAQVGRPKIDQLIGNSRAARRKLAFFARSYSNDAALSATKRGVLLFKMSSPFSVEPYNAAAKKLHDDALQKQRPRPDKTLTNTSAPAGKAPAGPASSGTGRLGLCTVCHLPLAGHTLGGCRHQTPKGVSSKPQVEGSLRAPVATTPMTPTPAAGSATEPTPTIVWAIVVHLVLSFLTWTPPWQVLQNLFYVYDGTTAYNLFEALGDTYGDEPGWRQPEAAEYPSDVSTTEEVHCLDPLRWGTQGGCEEYAGWSIHYRSTLSPGDIPEGHTVDSYLQLVCAPDNVSVLGQGYDYGTTLLTANPPKLGFICVSPTGA